MKTSSASIHSSDAYADANSHAAQAGTGQSLLFVGSNTAPNVIGLKWFLQTVWPMVLVRIPECDLRVAGTVKSAFETSYPRVQFLGLVDDLKPLYESAAVVISPLTVGSGLKIKLIEALAHGKSIVATTVSVEGTDDGVRSAVAVHDAPESFAAAIIELLSDRDLRQTKAAEALSICRQRYSSESCAAISCPLLIPPAEVRGVTYSLEGCRREDAFELGAGVKCRKSKS